MACRALPVFLPQDPHVRNRKKEVLGLAFVWAMRVWSLYCWYQNTLEIPNHNYFLTLTTFVDQKFRMGPQRGQRLDVCELPCWDLKVTQWLGTGVSGDTLTHLEIDGCGWEPSGVASCKDVAFTQSLSLWLKIPHASWLGFRTSISEKREKDKENRQELSCLLSSSLGSHMTSLLPWLAIHPDSRGGNRGFT